MTEPTFILTGRHGVPVTVLVRGEAQPRPVNQSPLFGDNLELDPPALYKAACAAIPVAGNFSVIATGFTPALLAVLQAAEGDVVRRVTFLHRDMTAGDYVKQVMFTACLHG